MVILAIFGNLVLERLGVPAVWRVPFEYFYVCLEIGQEIRAHRQPTCGL